MRADRKRSPRPRMPPDREIREALVACGMSEGEAADAVSQVLRIARADFFRRRRSRLLDLVQDRLLLVAAKAKLVDLLKREASSKRRVFNLEDVFTGIHHAELTNLGEVVLRRAIRELESEGIVQASTEAATMQLLSLTGRPFGWDATKLRDVYGRIRIAMRVRGARPYLIERTWYL